MRHVAILIETSRAYGRGLLRGIARYQRERGTWSTYFQPQGLGDPAPPWLAAWKGDGILARIDNRQLARVLMKANVPVVNLRGTIPDLPFPFIGSDNRAIARMAADHLLERGFRHFGFCGFRRGFHAKIDERSDYFQSFIKQAGQDFCSLRDTRQRPSWEDEQNLIARWIAALPKPVGILAANDDRGLQVLDACRRVGAIVPEEVAVLGVENDEFLCGLSLPPMSSIDMNSEETGYEAATLLDTLMAGKRPRKSLPEVRPAGVIVRRSTDVLATDDQDVVRAVRYIRAHACRSIRAVDVARHVCVSRSSLEARVRGVLGRSVHQEIRRVQIDTARALLADTDLPIKQVAHQSGFKNVQYLTRVFSNVTGKSPAVYRRDRSDRST